MERIISYTTTGTVVGNSVHLRNAPSSTALSGGLLYSGDSVLVLGNEKDWFYVKVTSGAIKGMTGYALIKYIYVSGKIKGNNVNLRSGPGENYSSGGQVHAGNTFQFLGAKTNSAGEVWYHVIMTSGPNIDLSGYVLNSLASL